MKVFTQKKIAEKNIQGNCVYVNQAGSISYTRISKKWPALVQQANSAWASNGGAHHLSPIPFFPRLFSFSGSTLYG